MDARAFVPQQPGGPARAGHEQFGVLGPLVADPSVTDIFINGESGVWVDRGRGAEREPLALLETDARALAVRLVALGGRHVDEATPCVDVRLGEGIRVHVVLAPLAPAGTLISVRIPRVTPFALEELDAAGFFMAYSVDEVRAMVLSRTNLLITGAGGSGKTTFLAALLGAAPPTERLVIVEDVAELRVNHPHVVSLEARQPNLEGVGGIGLPRLVRESLRMRPDRLVLGECRGEEVRELLSALNTGHDGGAGTVHANTLDDVPARLESLGALAGLGPEAVARQAASAIGAVLHLERVAGVRRLVGVGRLVIDARDRLRVMAA